MVKSFLLALSFFTRIPVNIKGEVTESEFFRSLQLMPVIGVFIGSFLYLLAFIFMKLDLNNVGAIVILTQYMILTGELHFDGLADTSEAILATRDKKKIFEIMQDPHIGTFGVNALTLALIALYVGIKGALDLNVPSLVFFYPICGRFFAIFFALFSEPAPEGGGLAKSFCKVINPGIVAIYFFLITALLIGLKRIDFLVSYFITIGLVYGEMVYFKKKLGGITGDQIGLVVELFQIFFIFISLMIVKVW